MYSLDTLSAARDLEAVGFNPQQAEAIVAAISRADEQLATKNDIAPLATKGDFEEIRLQITQLVTKEEFESKIAQLVTKEELRAQIAQLVTKDEFRAQITQLVTKEEFESKIAQLVTKEELRAQVALLESKIAAGNARTDSFRSEFRWVFGFLALFILAMAARMFEII